MSDTYSAVSIRGPDVSEFQEGIDWRELASRVHFAFIRLTDGTLLDTLGTHNWSASKGLLPRGAYGAFYPQFDPLLQAHTLVAAWGSSPGELAPVLDVESPAPRNSLKQPIPWGQIWVDNLRACLIELERLAGRTPIVYTGNWFWPNWIGLTPWSAQYPLWLSEFVPHADLVVPKPWSSCLFWQYGQGKGADYGAVSKVIDLNAFNGDEAAWAALITKDGAQPMTNKIRVSDGTQTIDFNPSITTTIVDVTPPPPGPTLDVWTESYYLGTAWAGAVVFKATSPGPALEHNWGSGSPNPAVPVDNFSAIFECDHVFTAGTYQVKVRSDDGFEYSVDGVVPAGVSGLIVQSAGSKEYVGQFTVTDGSHHLKVRYNEFAGAAEIHVSAPTFLS